MLITFFNIRGDHSTIRVGPDGVVSRAVWCDKLSNLDTNQLQPACLEFCHVGDHRVTNELWHVHYDYHLGSESYWTGYETIYTLTAREAISMLIREKGWRKKTG